MTKPKEIKIISPVDIKRFRSEFQRTHNIYRRLHGCAMITTDKQMNHDAQLWADQLATCDKMAHNPRTELGENIYRCQGFEPTGQHVSSAWYAEHVDYDFHNPGFRPQAAHFTAMIWMKTHQCGVGVARSSTGHYYVVANYKPRGNVANDFDRNVPPPRRNAKTGPLKTRRGLCGGGCCAAIPRLFSGCGSFTRFQRQCLNEHNNARRRHDAPPLRLDRQLCDEAQDWAVRLAANNAVLYMSWASFGQNIDCLKREAASADGRPREDEDRPAWRWYAERQNYTGSLTPQTSRFTQMIWRASEQFGVGMARSRTGETYTVAHYFPPGNINGGQDDNVRKWKA